MKFHWILMLALCCGSTAWSQEKPKPDTEPAADDSVQEEIVVSASRKPEKRVEAPATIEVIDAVDMLTSPATTFSGALAQVKGLDFANGGINLQKISTRGFSSSYKSRMISMVDGRLATLPGAGLPQGGFTPTSPLDIKSMEIVLGPASALYGPNATAGVFNLITKDPWDQAGVSAAVRAGEQSLVDLNLRYAETFDDRWGVKLTGEFLDGDEFDSENYFTVAGANQSTLTPAQLAAAIANGTAFREDGIAETNVTSKKAEVTGYYKGDGLKFSATYGWSTNDGFGVTNVGRNRIQGWEVSYLQAKLSNKHWYFHAVETENDAGETYAIHSVPALLAAGQSLEQARVGAKFIDRSKLTDAELQYRTTVAETDLALGGSWREYAPDSQGSYLDDFVVNGQHTDISRVDTGVYLQVDKRFFDQRLRLNAAARYDESDEYSGQFAPKVGLTYNQGVHYFRVSYNQAHMIPEVIENHLFFFGGLARGNLHGYDVRNAAGQTVARYEGLQPEEVKSYELGYRALLGGSVSLDAVAFYSDYDNFISPLQTIASPVFGLVAVDHQGNVIPVLLTYLNYGKATVQGFDLGFDGLAGEHLQWSASYSYQKMDSFENQTAIPDLPFNGPENKVKAQLTARDLGWANNFASLSGRWTEGYHYVSGRWNQDLPDTTILDFALGQTFKHEMTLKLSVTNLLDQNETEIVGAPAIPRFASLEIMKKF